jgi:branched-subunit amino acid transport protein
MSELQWTVVVLGAGLGTYLLRAAPFLWKRLLRFWRVYVRPLTYVSFAVAAGIISRAIFVSAGHLSFGTAAWVKVLAVAAAIAIYRTTRNMPVSLFSAVAIAVLALWLVGQLSGVS